MHTDVASGVKIYQQDQSDVTIQERKSVEGLVLLRRLLADVDSGYSGRSLDERPPRLTLYNAIPNSFSDNLLALFLGP